MNDLNKPFQACFATSFAGLPRPRRVAERLDKLPAQAEVTARRD